MSYVILFLAIFSGVAAAQAISFLPPVSAYVGGAAVGAGSCNTCLAAGDFNGDGKPDLAYSGQVQTPFAGVVLGNGDGTFRPGADFGLYLGSTLAADFNGDGKLDVVISGYMTWLFFGNGDGTFAAPVPVGGCSSTSTPTVSAAVDLNHDGKADLICGTTVFLSNGDGTFHNAGTVGSQAEETLLLVADFNKDGKPDVLLRRASSLLAVALGNGDGTFLPDVPNPTILVEGVVAGDFTGDGIVDLVGAANRGPFLDVLPGLGDGTFGPAVQTNIPNQLPGSLTAAGDFNKDGRLDLVVGDAIFAGNGDGTFRFPVFFGPVGDACGTAATPAEPDFFPCSYTDPATVVSDFNNDGLPDLAAGSTVQGFNDHSYVEFSVLLNDSPGDGFTTAGVSSATFDWPVAPGSIVSAFGSNLAPTKEAATGNSFPTTLGGIRVHVRDRSHTGDTLAPLIYVSPTQINYLMPSSDPSAWVGIEHVGSPYVAKGITVPIAELAPGFYTVDGNLAAADAVSRASDGTLVYTAVSSCTTLLCGSNAIDLSGPPVYLALYGTGFAKASAAASNCTIAGQTLPLTYAGPQLQMPGLDQANLLLPKSLAGAGATSISCQFLTTDQVFGSTNTVDLTIR